MPSIKCPSQYNLLKRRQLHSRLVEDHVHKRGTIQILHTLELCIGYYTQTYRCRYQMLYVELVEAPGKERRQFLRRVDIVSFLAGVKLRQVPLDFRYL